MEKLIETQILAHKDRGQIWYTAQYRRIYMFFRGRWKDFLPTMQPTYEDALEQSVTTIKTLINDKYRKP